MTRGGLWPLAALAAAALVLWPAGAAAQDIEITDEQVNRVARQLYCPVCENVPLDVCPTRACAQWREMIRRLLAEGRTEEDIKLYFVELYGARVLATPPAAGFNWLVYLVPPVVLAAGAAVLWRTLRGWRRSASTVVLEDRALEDPYVSRVEEELERRGGRT